MIIDTVEISNLGLWENLFLKFDKSINIIQGENGVGKTTLLALLYSLFHDSGIIKFTNKNQEAYICMNLHDSKEKLVLKKVYKKGQSGYFVSSFADIKKIARMEENKVFIFSGEFLDYDCQLNTKMIKNAMKLLKNVDMERYFSLAYEGVYMSQGQQSVIQILNLLYLIPCNGVQREHNKKLNNGLPILHKVPPKRDYGRYFCIMAEKGGTSHGGLTEKLSPFFHAQKQEVNAYGR